MLSPKYAGILFGDQMWIEGGTPNILGNPMSSQKGGGMNICEPVTWNVATLAKHIWHLAMKVDSLWIRLIEH